MNRLGLLAAAIAGMLAGCASYGEIANRPQTAQDRARPVYGLGRTTPAQDNERMTLGLAFSGGGARAAALAYGVLLELRDTRMPADGGPPRLLDEVDAISAVSGGSFTAAYYGLHGEATFPGFEQAFLRRDISNDLAHRLLSPLRWFSRETRSDEAARLFDRYIFHGARYADLQARPGPLVIINATDLEGGIRFAFLQEYFDQLCSDLLSYPLAHAVAASSAVPVMFQPVVLENYPGCTPHMPIDAAAVAASPQLQQEADGWRAYADKQGRRYVHLADGGLTDNLGLRAMLEAVDSAGGPRKFLQGIGRTPSRELVMLSVDASADASGGIGTSARSPSIRRMIDATTDIQLHRYNTATTELVQQRMQEWAKELADAGQPVRMRLVKVGFADIPDPALRARLNAIPTDFTLPSEDVDALIAAGRALLRANPEYQALLRDIGAEQAR